MAKHGLRRFFQITISRLSERHTLPHEESVAIMGCFWQPAKSNGCLILLPRVSLAIAKVPVPCYPRLDVGYRVCTGKRGSPSCRDRKASKQHRPAWLGIAV